VPRRVSLPSADELFRATGDATTDRARVRAVPETVEAVEAIGADPGVEDVEDDPADTARRPSGRVRHDEKMTVYVTSDELVDIEHARLSLRRSHGLVVDRGRLVREAVAMVLADLETNGADSALVRRLTDE
jgi:hypothetical protein